MRRRYSRGIEHRVEVERQRFARRPMSFHCASRHKARARHIGEVKLHGRVRDEQAAELYACLHAKEFPAQALLRLRPELREQPCVVMEGEPPLQLVCSLNRKARSLGMAHGMTQVEVDTFSGVTALRRSHSEEAAAKAALLECAGAFSPRVEDRSEDGAFLCVIDIAGTKAFSGRRRCWRRIC